MLSPVLVVRELNGAQDLKHRLEPVVSCYRGAETPHRKQDDTHITISVYHSSTLDEPCGADGNV
jgi:hypothetical protein